MILNRLFEYPPLERVTLPSGERFYKCVETNSSVPSVTTIIGATSGKKEALKEWEDWVGTEKADRTRKEATNLGSLVHLHLENHIQGLERPKGTMPIRIMSKNMSDVVIEKGLSMIKEVNGIEAGLVYPGTFAGTCDLIAVLNDGRQAIIDFKTASKMRTLSMIEEDYSAQLGAYGAAHDLKYGTDIDVGIIMMVSRDLQFKAFQFNDLKAKSALFMGRLEKYLEMMISAEAAA